MIKRNISGLDLAVKEPAIGKGAQGAAYLLVWPKDPKQKFILKKNLRRPMQQPIGQKNYAE